MRNPQGPRARAQRVLLRLLAGAMARLPHWWVRPCRPAAWRRVLVYQGGGLGDVLRMFPVLEALREATPTARIMLLVELRTPFEDLLPQAGLVEAVIRMDLEGTERTPLGKLRLARRLRRECFDAVINGNRGAGMLENALFCAAVGARDRIGFTQAGAGFPFTVQVPFTDDAPIATQNLTLLAAAGLSVTPRQPRVQVAPPDRAFAQDRLAGSPRPWIAVHPFARREGRFRAWPLDRYAGLVAALTAGGAATVLLLGDAQDRALLPALGALPSSAVLDLVGRTSLGQTAALLEAVDLFIGNDSGLLHLALAVDRPAVGIFGSTPPEQVVGAHAKCVPVRTGLLLACQPCYRHQPFFEIVCDHMDCLCTLGVDQVLTAVEARLRTSQRFQAPRAEVFA